MPYKPKKKPERTYSVCAKCGKVLTEHEIFFGLCRCQHPLHPQVKKAMGCPCYAANNALVCDRSFPQCIHANTSTDPLNHDT